MVTDKLNCMCCEFPCSPLRFKEIGSPRETLTVRQRITLFAPAVLVQNPLMHHRQQGNA